MKHGTNGTIGTRRQRGISLTGLIFTLAVLGVIGLLGLKIVPTFIEYRAIVGAIRSAKTAGSTPAEVQAAFDKSASVTYIDSIRGKDLLIGAENGQIEVSFAYEKKIPLIGFASLVLDYAGSTASGAPAAKPAE